jgi:hypothetical protein
MDVKATADDWRFADGEVVWSWHPGADAKVVGFDEPAADGGKRAGPRGEYV